MDRTAAGKDYQRPQESINETQNSITVHWSVDYIMWTLRRIYLNHWNRKELVTDIETRATEIIDGRRPGCPRLPNIAHHFPAISRPFGGRWSSYRPEWRKKFCYRTKIRKRGTCSIFFSRGQEGRQFRWSPQEQLPPFEADQPYQRTNQRKFDH